MSSTKNAAAKPVGGAAANAANQEPPTPPQTAVLLVQVEALDADETIRAELKKSGFVVATQALVYLTPDDARHFVLHVGDPRSPLHAKPAENGGGGEGDGDGDGDGDGADRASSSSTSATPTPRDKVGSPRSPRSVGEAAEPATRRSGLEDAVHGLSRGPVLMLALEKANAVADLQDLVGPATPELWSAAPGCLRARLGVDTQRIGVRCTAHETAAAHEVAFLLAHTHAPSGAGHHRHHSQRAHEAAKAAAVDLRQLLQFLFPPHVLHANSTGRLFVFGLYGPLDGRAQLRSGERGLHVVTDRELDTMSSRMEREDILSVYDMCSLLQEEEEEVLRSVDGALKAVPRYSPRDVEALFQWLERDADGRLSFHDMQAAIMKERCRRVLCMKQRLHPALAGPIQNKFRQTMTRVMKTKHEIAPASMFIRDLGFTGAENATLVSRLLSNHSFEICHLDDGNAPALTQNVRLLRDQIHAPSDSRAPWNPNTRGGRK